MSNVKKKSLFEDILKDETEDQVINLPLSSGLGTNKAVGRTNKAVK